MATDSIGSRIIDWAVAVGSAQCHLNMNGYPELPIGEKIDLGLVSLSTLRRENIQKIFLGLKQGLTKFLALTADKNGDSVVDDQIIDLTMRHTLLLNRVNFLSKYAEVYQRTNELSNDVKDLGQICSDENTYISSEDASFFEKKALEFLPKIDSIYQNILPNEPSFVMNNHKRDFVRLVNEQSSEFLLAKMRCIRQINELQVVFDPEFFNRPEEAENLYAALIPEFIDLYDQLKRYYPPIEREELDVESKHREKNLQIQPYVHFMERSGTISLAEQQGSGRTFQLAEQDEETRLECCKISDSMRAAIDTKMQEIQQLIDCYTPDLGNCEIYEEFCDQEIAKKLDALFPFWHAFKTYDVFCALVSEIKLLHYKKESINMVLPLLPACEAIKHRQHQFDRLQGFMNFDLESLEDLIKRIETVADQVVIGTDIQEAIVLKLLQNAERLEKAERLANAERVRFNCSDEKGIYYFVWKIASEQDASIGGDGWGKRHAAKDLPRLLEAIHRTIEGANEVLIADGSELVNASSEEEVEAPGPRTDREFVNQLLWSIIHKHGRQ